MDIGKPVKWYDLDLRVERRGMLKGLSSDGCEGYVLAVQRRRTGLRAKAPAPKLETHAVDLLHVVTETPATLPN